MKKLISKRAIFLFIAIFSLLIAFTACDNGTTSSPIGGVPVDGGGIVGTWVHSQNSAVRLVFSTDGSVAYTFGTGPGDTMNGTYSVSGSTVTLNLPGLGTTTATISGSSLTWHLNGIGITFNRQSPIITTSSLPGGTVGVTYNQTLTATGATPITWSRESGALPGGLNLASNGTISGIPTTAGTFNFTVRAANAAGSTSRNFTIVIAAPGGGGGGGGGNHLGATLNLSGQVFIGSWNHVTQQFSYVPFNGSGSVSGFMGNQAIGGTGSINNGQLNFSIGTPTRLTNAAAVFFFGGYLNNFHISAPQAQAADLCIHTHDNRCINRHMETSSGSSGVYENVQYIFVDRDLTIRADRTVITEHQFSETINAFNITLRQGWNPLHYRAVWSINTAGFETATSTLSLGNPAHLQWRMY